MGPSIRPNLPSRYSRQWWAAIVTALTPALLCSLLVGLVERPSWRFGHSHVPQTAAIVLRDDVPAAQQWISSVFTRPYLVQGYEHSIYLDDSAHGGAHQQFVRELTDLLQNYAAVDILILAHTNDYIEWVKEVDPALRRTIRLVYNTGCFNSDQLDAWLHLGADAAIGHPALSASPIFYVYFLRRWTLDMPADQALEVSNQSMYTILQRASTFAAPNSFGILMGLDSTFSDAEQVYASSQAYCAGRCGISISEFPKEAP